MRRASLPFALALLLPFFLSAQASPAGCPHLTRVLQKGSTGTEVSALQKFLSLDQTIYPEGLVTGYFGAATERAVQRFQHSGKLLSSGTPGSNGFGIVGPRTRALMMQVCQRVMIDGQTHFDGYPTEGKSPLKVTFYGVLTDTEAKAYTLDFGDGSSRTITSTLQNACASDKCKKYYAIQIAHSYESGIFSAHLYNAMTNESVGKVKVAVGVGASLPAAGSQTSTSFYSNGASTYGGATSSVSNYVLQASGANQQTQSGQQTTIQDPWNFNVTSSYGAATATGQYYGSTGGSSTPTPGSCRTWIGAYYSSGTVLDIKNVTTDYQEVISSPTYSPLAKCEEGVWKFYWRGYCEGGTKCLAIPYVPDLGVVSSNVFNYLDHRASGFYQGPDPYHQGKNACTTPDGNRTIAKVSDLTTPQLSDPGSDSQSVVLAAVPYFTGPTTFGPSSSDMPAMGCMGNGQWVQLGVCGRNIVCR